MVEIDIFKNSSQRMGVLEMNSKGLDIQMTLKDFDGLKTCGVIHSRITWMLNSSVD